MYNKKKIEMIALSIDEIIFRDYRKYIENRKNDISIKDKIDEEIAYISSLEDLALTISHQHEIPTRKEERSSITLSGYTFKYDPEREEFVFEGDKENAAKCKVYYREGLSYTYTHEKSIYRRIRAILSTVNEDSFDNLLDHIKKNIDFNEFINLSKTNSDSF